METLILLVAAFLAFAFGYRFYAKLLALGIFGLDTNYSTPARTRTDDRDYVPTSPYFLLGQHIASVSMAGTVAGTVIAAIWGWIPAFLWIVTGTAAAAGTYGIGSLWLSVRRPVGGVFTLTHEFIGRYAAYGAWLLAAVVLLLLNAIALGLAADLLSRYPGSVLPFWLLLPLAVGLGAFLHGRREVELIPASAVALGVALGAVALLADFPIAMTGELNLEIGGSRWLSVNAVSVWAALLLAYAFVATRAPIWRAARPRAYVSALLALVTLLLLFIGVFAGAPPIVAPQFHQTETLPTIFPWLFVTISGGALAGFHLLVAHSVTAKQLRREHHARYIGYAGAVVDGLIALGAVIVAITAFTDTAAWNAHYADWRAGLDLSGALTLYIDGFVRYVGGLGIGSGFARTLVTVTLAALSLATLEAGLRALKYLLVEVARADGFEPAPARRAGERPGDERVALHIAAWGTLLVAFSDGRGLAGANHWTLFGSANLLLAGVGLLLIGMALRSARRPALLLFAPAAFALTLAAWAIALQLIQAAADGHWLAATLAGLLLSIEIAVAIDAAGRLRRNPEAPAGFPLPPNA